MWWMKMLKFGIVGCGSIAPVHARAIHNNEHANLAACCDNSEKKAATFAEKYHCRAYKDYQGFLASDIDVVTIATPHYLHKEMTIQAIQAGKHVICEKPMALTIPEANEVMAVVNQSNQHYAVCFQNRFNPSFMHLKELIKQEKFGKLKGMKCELTWNRNLAYYQSAIWKGKLALEGGGVLINQALHTLDAISWLYQQPKCIKGKVMTSILSEQIEVEDSAMATALLSDKTPITIFATNNYSSDPSPLMTFDFEKSVVEVTMEALIVNGEPVELRKITEEENKKNVWGDGHQRVVDAFVQEIISPLSVRDPLLAKGDGRNALSLMEGIYRSDKTNQWAEVTAY